MTWIRPRDSSSSPDGIRSPVNGVQTLLHGQVPDFDTLVTTAALALRQKATQGQLPHHLERIHSRHLRRPYAVI